MKAAIKTLLFATLLAIATSARAAAVTPPANLISWWPGDDSGNELVAGANATSVNGANYGAGQVAQAFNLNGGNYFQAPDSPQYTFGTNEFSIELWANFAASSGQRTFVASDTGGGNQNKWIFWLNGGVLQFHINGSFGANFVGTAPFSPTLNQWYHVAVTRQSNNYIFYINGAAVSTNVNTITIPDPNASLTIGSAEGSIFFNGRLDEISIYNRALAGSEITSIYTAGVDGKDKQQFPPLPILTAAATNRIYLNSTITYTARLSGGQTNATWQWLKDGVAISGETNSALTLPNQVAPLTAVYSVRAQNAVGTNISAPTTLVVRPDAGRAVPPVAQWRFNESPGSPTAADSTTNNYTGTLSGGAAFTNKAWLGNALSLNLAASSFVNMGNVLPLTGTSFTIVSWVRNTETGPGAYIARHAAGTANGYIVWQNAQPGYGQANKAGLYTSTPGSSGRDPRSTTNVNDDQWHQVVAIHRGDNSQNRIYVDGSPMESTTGADNVVANTATFMIGGLTSAGVPTASYNGLIDEVQIFNRELTDEQIDYLYTHPAATNVIEQDVAAGVYVWTDPISGSWTDPIRWTPFGPPPAGATVMITNDGTYTVTLNTSATVANLHVGYPNSPATGMRTLAITAGTLTVTNTRARVNSTIGVAGGTLLTTGTFDSAGTVYGTGGSWRLLTPGTVSSYNLTNGELRGANLTVTNFTWAGANLYADAPGDKTIIPPGGTFNLVTDTARVLSYYAGGFGRGVDNRGTWNWYGNAVVTAYPCDVNNYGTLNFLNQGTPGTYAQFGNTIATLPNFNNFGTINKPVGTNIVYFGPCNFSNSGGVNFQGGTAALYHGTSTNSGSITVQNTTLLAVNSTVHMGGTVNLASDSIFQTDSGTVYVVPSGSLTISGTNAFRIYGGTVNLFTTNVTAPTAWIAGGTLFHQTNNTIPVINESSGTWRMIGTQTVSTYNHTNGELRGGTLIITNCNWYNGNWYADAPGDKTIIPVGGVLNMFSTAGRVLSYYAGGIGRHVDNRGTWNWADNSVLTAYPCDVNNYGTINFLNQGSPGSYAQFGNTISTLPNLNNFGTITKPAGTNIVYFGPCNLNNANLISFPAGIAILYNGTTTNSGAINMNNSTLLVQASTVGVSGQVNISANSIFQTDSGTVTFYPASILTSPGYNAFRINGGTVNIQSANISANSAWLNGGTLYHQSPNTIPIINESGASTWRLSGAHTVSAYNLTNGELRGGTLTVTNFNWYNGNLNADANGDKTIIPTNGVLNMFSTALRYLSHYAPATRGRDLDNLGTWNWLDNSTLVGVNPAVVNNYGNVNVTGTGADGTSAQFSYNSGSSGPIWNNYGTLTKTGGTNQFYLSAAYVNNYGTMDFQSGTCVIWASTFTNYNLLKLSASATWNNDNNSSSTFVSGSSVTSPGNNRLQMGSGSVFLQTVNITAPNFLINNGTLYQQAPNVLPQMNQANGVWKLYNSVAIQSYNLTNGELRGGSLTVTNFNWFNGNLNADANGDKLIIPTNGVLNFIGTPTRYLSHYAPATRGRDVDHFGTWNWLDNSTLIGVNPAVVNNHGVVNVTGTGAGGTYSQFAYNMGSATPTWNNYGTFTKSGGTNLFYFSSCFFNNSGMLSFQSGTLDFSASTATNLSAGTILLGGASQLINEGGSTTTLNPGSTLAGSAPNALAIPSGTVYVKSTAITMPSLLISGGTLQQDTNNMVSQVNQTAGTWQLNVPTTATTYNLTNGDVRGLDLTLNNLNWVGGNLLANGPTNYFVTVNDSLKISGNTAKAMSYVSTQPGRNLINNGSATWTGVGITGQGGATFRNNGSLTVSNDVGLVWGGAGPLCTLDNVGTFAKSAGTGVAAFGSTIITNSGNFTVASGGISFGALYQPSGSTALGTNFSASSLVRVAAGSFTGQGIVAGSLYNNALLSPGASPGLITAAHYTNTAAAIANIELGGATLPGVNYDQIRATGVATLAGNLNVSLVNNFAPQLSNSFTVMTFASRVGTYASINPPPGVTLDALYSTTNLVLTVIGLTNAPLQITLFPTNQTIWTPDPVTFTVGVSGSTPISYQWQRFATNLPSATNNSFTIPAVSVADAGTYTLLVTDGYGGTTNASATLTVIPFDGTIYWANTNGGNWSVAANWAPTRVPTITNNVVIASNGNYTVNVNADGAAKNLFVGSLGASTQTVHLISGSTLNLSSNSIFASNSIFQLNGLFQTAGGTNYLNGRVEWYSGTLSGPGRSIVGTNATWYFVGSLVGKYIVSNIVENFGQFTYSGDAGIGPGQLPGFSGGAQLTNHLSGVINMNANSLYYSGAQTPRTYLVNFGKIVAATSTVWSPSTIGIDFINYGLLENYSYAYLFRGRNYGTIWGYNGLTEVSIFGDPGAGEYFSFEPGTALTGVGPNIACGGPVQWLADNTVHNGSLRISQGSGGATYANAEFKILANYTNTAALGITRGALTIPNPATITHLRSYSDGFVSFWSFGVTNAGTMYVDNFSHVIYGFGNGGNLIIRTNGALAGGSVYGTGHMVITPTATATLSGMNLDGQFVENFGQVSVTGNSPLTGGTYWENKSNANIYFGGGSMSTGPASLANFGTMNGFGGLYISATNHNLVTADDSLNRYLNLGDYWQAAGETRLRGGHFSGPMTLLGGTLNGAGNVGSVVNGAGVLPGLPVGIISAAGGYTNLTSGVYHMQIGGTNNYDRIDVAGTAQFAGTLNLTLTNSFFPVVGSTFTAMTYTARSGVFANVVMPGYQFEVIYLTNALILRASNALPVVSFYITDTQPYICNPVALITSGSDLDGAVTNVAFYMDGGLLKSVSGNNGRAEVEIDFPMTGVFSTRVTDDRGGVSWATQSVTWATMPLHTLTLGGMRTNNRNFKICMVGQNGASYEILMSTNLPTTNWPSIGLMNNYTNNLWRFFDSNATNVHRYYRARMQ